MIKYVFNEGPVAIKAAKKADPQVIGETLARIAASADGRLHPADVVEAARSNRNPLHKHFEWDDAKAAHAFRLDQAREIIRIVRIEDEETRETPRAYLSVSDKGGCSYRSRGDVQNSRNLQLLVLQQAERDLESFERRYRELIDVCDMVKIARETVSTRRQAVELSH